MPVFDKLLSTLKGADQIVVLEKGKIVEVGTHEELTCIMGKYFQLVKNQLELETRKDNMLLRRQTADGGSERAVRRFLNRKLI